MFDWLSIILNLKVKTDNDIRLFIFNFVKSSSAKKLHFWNKNENYLIFLNLTELNLPYFLSTKNLKILTSVLKKVAGQNKSNINYFEIFK